MRSRLADQMLRRLFKRNRINESQQLESYLIDVLSADLLRKITESYGNIVISNEVGSRSGASQVLLTFSSTCQLMHQLHLLPLATLRATRENQLLARLGHTRSTIAALVHADFRLNPPLTPYACACMVNWLRLGGLMAKCRHLTLDDGGPLPLLTLRGDKSWANLWWPAASFKWAAEHLGSNYILSALVIAGLLKCNRGSLTKIGEGGLDLRGEIGEEGWAAIIGAVCSSTVSKITSIDASSQGIGPKGAKLIGEALRTSVNADLTTVWTPAHELSTHLPIHTCAHEIPMCVHVLTVESVRQQDWWLL